jgi:hypothetical protein
MAEITQTTDQNLETTPSPTGYEAIDFEETYRAMNVGLQYIAETRMALEQAGPQKWISDLVARLSHTAQMIREFELEHTDDTILWRDEQGNPHEVLARLQDEKRFDEVMKEYAQAEKEFDEYFARYSQVAE